MAVHYSIAHHSKTLTPGIKKVLRIFGNQAALAKAMNVSVSAVARWGKSGYIPCDKVWEVMLLVEDKKTYAGETVSINELLEEAYNKHMERRGLQKKMQT